MLNQLYNIYRSFNLFKSAITSHLKLQILGFYYDYQHPLSYYFIFTG